jgi:hypothetical protein
VSGDKEIVSSSGRTIGYIRDAKPESGSSSSPLRWEGIKFPLIYIAVPSWIGFWLYQMFSKSSPATAFLDGLVSIIFITPIIVLMIMWLEFVFIFAIIAILAGLAGFLH